MLLYTGQRASDAAILAWPDVTDDGIWVVQQKTKAKFLVPIHDELQEILISVQGREGMILQTSFNKPFTAKGFSNYMADKINQAGLPERCVAHGLRKAAARRLAEARCCANEIASITGHVTLDQVARYTRAAEQSASHEPPSTGSRVRQTQSHSQTDLAVWEKKPAKKPNIFNTENSKWRAGQDETANTYVIEVAL